MLKFTVILLNLILLSPVFAGNIAKNNSGEETGTRNLNASTYTKDEISASDKKNIEKEFNKIVSSMMAQLRIENIEGALSFFEESRRDKHRQKFKAMKDNNTLKAFVDAGFINVEIESIDVHGAE